LISFNKIDEAITKSQEVAKLEEELDPDLINILKNTKLRKTDIQELVENITGIPVSTISSISKEQIRDSFAKVRENIIGQKGAIDALEKAYKTNITKVNKGDKPVGVFLFTGPTGVGKTEVTKCLAKYVYKNENIIRLDMSEFQDSFTSSKIIGAPPGFVGYEKESPFLEQVRRNPYSVILLDEVEKAHPDIFNLFLALFDDGFITTARGKKINFKNTMIIMTSNLGSKAITNKGSTLGFSSGESQYDSMKNKVMESVKEFFSPEFLNRLDDIIVFKELNTEELIPISDIYLKELRTKVRNMYKLDLSVSEEVLSYIIGLSDKEKLGARPLRRAFTQYLEDPLSSYILQNVIDKDHNTKCLDVSIVDNDIKVTGS
jgi:ATP-dependent Clp protease ATP-binding subunit ClpC